MESRISIHCRCGKVSEVSRKHIGKTLTCPHCGIARIKIKDPDDGQTGEDEAEPERYSSSGPDESKSRSSSLVESANGTATVEAPLWHLNVICCLLAIIAGIMVYNQFGEYVSKAIAEFLKG